MSNSVAIWCTLMLWIFDIFIQNLASAHWSKTILIEVQSWPLF